jgi:hypothetical protein
MVALSYGLMVMAYVLALVDGIAQDKGVYPSSPGRMGVRVFSRKHPWLLAGAACGMVGTGLGAVAS